MNETARTIVVKTPHQLFTLLQFYPVIFFLLFTVDFFDTYFQSYHSEKIKYTAKAEIMGRTNDEFSPLTPLDPRIDAILVKGIKPVAPPKKNTGRKICLCNVLMAVVASAALAGLAYFTFSYRRIQNDNERLRTCPTHRKILFCIFYLTWHN